MAPVEQRGVDVEAACHPHTPKKHLPPLAEPVQWHHDSKGNPGMDVENGRHIVSAEKIPVYHSGLSEYLRNTTEMV